VAETIECRSRTLAGSQLYLNQRVFDKKTDLQGDWIQLKKSSRQRALEISGEIHRSGPNGEHL
jgi:hypothetical protein